MMLRGGGILARVWGEPAARTVLCWHGAGGSSADFAPIAPELVDRLGVRVVAIDAPGHARSVACPPEALRPSALATLAAEIGDELGSERFAFLGFSWGATVGCWVGARYPERILGLALVEGGHLDFADLPGFRTDLTLDELTAEAEAVAISEGEAFGTHTPAVAGAMVHGLCREPATDTYAHLAASATPVLFVGAQQAPVERLARVVPQTEVVRLSSPGHDVLQNAPADVARVVGRWLAKLP
jgi:pimeloyl-ACP methyl ester carboxylesterase